MLAAIVAGLGISAALLRYLQQDRITHEGGGSANRERTQAASIATLDAVRGNLANRPAAGASGGESITLDADRAEARAEPESQAPVTLTVEDAVSTLVVQSATVEEVLDALGATLNIEIIDLRPSDARKADAEQADRLSFSFSGTADAMVRFVMDQYGYSYAISYRAREVASQPETVAKLFVYGSGEEAEPDELAAGTDAGAGKEAQVSAAPASAAGGLTAEPKPTVAEVLRSRALHAGQAVPRSADVPSAGGRPPEVSSAGGNAPVVSDVSGVSPATSGDESYTSDQDRLNAELAEMTRKARQDVGALVEGLKQVEDSLKAAQTNAP